MNRLLVRALRAARSSDCAPEPEDFSIRNADIDPSLSRTEETGRVYTGDGLTGEFPDILDASFDTVVANPPFGRCRAAMSEGQLGRVLDGSPRVFEIWQGGAPPSGDASSGHVRSGRSEEQWRLLGSAPIEHLFLERCPICLDADHMW